MGSLMFKCAVATLVLYRSSARASPGDETGPGAEGALQGGLKLAASRYPVVYRNESVKDTYFGVDVHDPYRWLEAPEPSKTAGFVAAQNDLTDTFMAPFYYDQQRFYKLYYRLYVSQSSCPWNRPVANQPFTIYWAQDTNFYAKTRQSPAARLVFNSSLLGPKGVESISGFSINSDQSYLAISLTNNASDWRKVRVVAIDKLLKGRLLEDSLENTKGDPLWSSDGKGFFYVRFPYKDPTSFVDRGSNNSVIKYPQLWYHTVGTKQAEDFRLLAFPGHPTWVPAVDYSDDKKYLVITIDRNEQYNKLWVVKVSDLPVNKATGGLDLSVFDRQDDNGSALPVIKLVDDFRAIYEVLFTDGDIFTIGTNVNSTQMRAAANYSRYDADGRIVRTNVTEMLSSDQWPTLVPADNENILQTAMALPGGAFVASYLRRMTPVLQIRRTSDGSFLKELPLPKFDTVGGAIDTLCPGQDETDFYYIYTSQTDPGTIYRFDTALPDVLPSIYYRSRIPAGYNTYDIVTRLVSVTSKDGSVQIPLLITSRKDISLDSLNPTILYAYGGFNLVVGQSYDASVIAWILGYGGVYASAAIRGGGDLGVKWWKDGQGIKRQNSFDDFISCAQYLILNKITSSKKLGIQGASNGGLLMGTMLNQAPSLWSAVVAEVGLYDMLRFPLFGIGSTFVREYGDARRNETVFHNLLSYSPLHNVRVPNGTRQYPATLVTTGDHDDRVAPLHSYKFIATLQYELAKRLGSAQVNPLLMYVRSHGGHAGAFREMTMVFIARALNASWMDPRTSSYPAY